MDIPKELKDLPVIMLKGVIVGETGYRLEVSNFPSNEVARKFAALIAGYAAQAMEEAMGGPAREALVTGAGATEEIVADIKKKGGSENVKVMTGSIAETITASIREAMEELEKDDCECPGCVARRAHEAKIAAGSNSDAKH